MVTSAPWPNNIFILSPILGLKVSIIIFLFTYIHLTCTSYMFCATMVPTVRTRQLFDILKYVTKQPQANGKLKDQNLVLIND